MKNSLGSIIDSGLCAGCGMCAGICPKSAIKFVWDKYGDYVPSVDEKKCIGCGFCVRVCPGKEVDFNQIAQFQNSIEQESYVLKQGVGLCKGIKLVRSSEEGMLKECTSGGGVRTIAAYLVQNKLVDGAIMITDNHEQVKFPFYAKPTLFYDADEIKCHKVHSRYCPAPLCSILSEIDKSKKYVFIGLPCHVHALRKLQAIDEEWRVSIPYVLGLLCCGTPTANGTRYLFRAHGIDVSKIVRVDYRYGEFPGGVYGFMADGTKIKVKNSGSSFLSLNEALIGEVFMSSFFLRRRCLSCLDFFCNFSDLTFGDPWIKRHQGKKERASLVYVHSNKGENIFNEVCSQHLFIAVDNVQNDEVKGMVSYQTGRWENYYGSKKHGNFLNLNAPAYQSITLRGKGCAALKSLAHVWWARFGIYEGLWWMFKYIQLCRIGMRLAASTAEKLREG